MIAGNIILMARRRAELTQRELASRVGCQQATVARWERGDRQPAFQDVTDVVGACGLQLYAHLLSEDRSWWPQIAAQLERTPIQRIRRLTPPGSLSDVMLVLEALVETQASAVVIGEVAGALHGWPLVLSGGVVEVCARRDELDVMLERLLEMRARTSELPLGRRLSIIECPPGTSGYDDLARSAESVDINGGTLRVAGLLDLLRVADASPDPGARRRALAYQAVLDVQRAQSEHVQVDDKSDEEKIQAWLSKQIPVA
jgi:transcriptional regulator with XRE-family HTH domain